MRVLDQWLSLGDQVELADQLFGQPTGRQKVADWLAEQMSFVDDNDFAQQFAAHVTLPGIEVLDYAHRHLRTARGELLGGIRFYGRDITRPFVDVLAHNFADIDALIDCVNHEWSNFNPPFLRLRTTPGLLAHRPDVILDKTIHLARYRDMAPADSRVMLDEFDAAEEAIDLVDACYARLADTHPALARNLSPADPDDLREWHQSGQLRAIRRHDTIIGALAIATGEIDWIGGEEVLEEVISEPHMGQRYAASAQMAWAQYMAIDTNQLLVGAIDRHNHASRATALRAGRPCVLDDIFVAMAPPPTRSAPPDGA